jgi:GntR family transcriptional regulator of vanillate catabolism
MKFLSQIQPVSLREQVVEQVRAAIIEGRLRPHDHITEAILTEQLGVSRTPVREALILLEREGLVVFAPNRGAFVRAFNPEAVEELFSMRTVLENFAAECIIEKVGERDITRLERLIAQQEEALEQGDLTSARSIDMEFHRTLVRRSSNRLLIRSWEEIVAQIAALLHMRQESNPEFDESRAIRDHQAILQAYRARDLAAVQAANRQINAQAAQECLQSLAKSDHLQNAHGRS